MSAKNLFVMCGIPGSGKSTWISQNRPNAYVISRDKVRFSLVQEDQPYFSQETKVFKTFIKQIQDALDSDDTPQDIYCDATHITKASRDKLFNALNLKNVENVIVIVLRPTLQETLRRNNLRVGRERVPESAIIRMWHQFQRPENDEDRIFDTMYVEV